MDNGYAYCISLCRYYDKFSQAAGFVRYIIHIANINPTAGIAYELGYPDGEEITLDDVALIVEQIVRRVDLPLSVDFERGYADTIEQVKSNAKTFGMWCSRI